MAAPYAFTHSREGKGMVTSGHSLRLPNRLREPPEQRTLDVDLRMPLHGEHPRLAVRWLGALDHTVGRPGRGAQRRREVADRPLATAAHCGLERGERAMQGGTR